MRVFVYSTGIVRNELVCGYIICQSGTAYVKFIPSPPPSPNTHTHSQYHLRTREPTGLKVDIAEVTFGMGPWNV